MSERAFTVSDLNNVIGEYRQQHQQAVDRLRQLDEERVHLLKALDLVQGAILALETLRDTPLPVQEPPQEDGK